MFKSINKLYADRKAKKRERQIEKAIQYAVFQFSVGYRRFVKNRYAEAQMVAAHNELYDVSAKDLEKLFSEWMANPSYEYENSHSRAMTVGYRLFVDRFILSVHFVSTINSFANQMSDFLFESCLFEDATNQKYKISKDAMELFWEKLPLAVYENLTRDAVDGIIDDNDYFVFVKQLYYKEDFIKQICSVIHELFDYAVENGRDGNPGIKYLLDTFDDDNAVSRDQLVPWAYQFMAYNQSAHGFFLFEPDLFNEMKKVPEVVVDFFERELKNGREFMKKLITNPYHSINTLELTSYIYNRYYFAKRDGDSDAVNKFENAKELSMEFVIRERYW